MREPIVAEPYFSPRLWGSRDLRPFYPARQDEAAPIGEAWLTAERCRLALAPDLSLGALAAAAAPELLGPLPAGAAPLSPGEFPILVKLLFPHDYLSVQVHPDDAYARRHGFGRGKTEMWHVLQAAPGARLGLNLLPGKTLGQLAEACRAGRSRELIEWLEAAPGDTFFVPAGTVHALGPGLVLCEVQQQSDSTFRLDDYGRRDEHGQLRALHLTHGLAVAQPRTAAGRVARHLRPEQGGRLATSPYFQVEKHVLHGGAAVAWPAGFRIVVPLAGELALAAAQTAGAPSPVGASPPLPVAHAVIIPAASGAWEMRGAGTALDITLGKDE